jgi:hypothetical protein
MIDPLVARPPESQPKSPVRMRAAQVARNGFSSPKTAVPTLLVSTPEPRTRRPRGEFSPVLSACPIRPLTNRLSRSNAKDHERHAVWVGKSKAMIRSGHRQMPRPPMRGAPGSGYLKGTARGWPRRPVSGQRSLNASRPSLRGQGRAAALALERPAIIEIVEGPTIVDPRHARWHDFHEVAATSRSHQEPPAPTRAEGERFFVSRPGLERPRRPRSRRGLP